MLEQSNKLLGELVDTSIHFIRNHVNRVAHMVDRLSCLVNCHNDLSSLPDCLVETVLKDI